MLHEQGALGGYTAAPAGELTRALAAAALGEGDWLFTDGVGCAAPLARGATPAEILHHARGDVADPTLGHPEPPHLALKRARVVPAGTRNGAHLTHAAGLAWAAKMKHDAVVALALFDDAAVGTAELHHAVNFAGAFGAPAVFVCLAHESTRPEERGIAYGVATATCDASAPATVLETVAGAVEHARGGGGAVFVEVHASGDEAAALAMLRAELRGLGQGETIDGLDAWAERTVAEASAEAEKAGPPARASMFDGVYATLPWHLLQQRGGERP